MYNLLKSDDKNLIPILDRNLYYKKYSCKNRVYENILETVGSTPLVKLNRVPIAHNLQCELYVKCEFMNPGGSIKDRIAVSMVHDAENTHSLNTDTTLYEGSSGNTGLGIALVAAVKNYKSIIISTDKNSEDKFNATRLLGAKVVVCKAGLPETDPDSEFATTRRLRNADPNGALLDQYENNANPQVHYDHTAAEIIEALEGRVDMFACGSGTGGTLTGTATRIKEVNPQCIIVAADPDGSTLINKNGKRHPYLVEGLGGSSDEVPIVLDKSVINVVEVVNDEDAFHMARELARTEGILCGGSSGLAVCAAIQAAKRLKLGPGRRVVVILPDGIRNYMSKFVSDQWMEAQLFKDPPKYINMRWWKQPITELRLLKAPQVNKEDNLKVALKAIGDGEVALVTENKVLLGIITKDSIRRHFTTPREDKEPDFVTSKVKDYLEKDCFTLALNGKKGVPTVGRLSRVLDITTFVIVGTETWDENNKANFYPEAVGTCDIVLDYIQNLHSKNFGSREQHLNVY